MLTSTFSLHDALPIFSRRKSQEQITRAITRDAAGARQTQAGPARQTFQLDRKSTRLNSSHEWISYAVFCLKKKIKLEQHSRNLNVNMIVLLLHSKIAI